ncbi:MAG: pentapeptide repeat-containing protein [Leptolyngbyaceae cyanobacterium]
MAQVVPTLGRRLLAWSLELVVLTGSMAGPAYLGHQLNEISDEPKAELSTTLRAVQQHGAKLLGVPPRSLPTQVSPWTNLLWSAALSLPILLIAGHVYSLGRHGHSWPKRWLGLQVLALNGQMPGIGRAIIREVVGKWGTPLAIAYGVWVIGGAFPVIGALVGLSGVALLAESLTGLSNRPRRAWHDWISGTCLVDQETGAIIHLSSLWQAEAQIPQGLGRASDWMRAVGPAAVVMNPEGARWQVADLTLPKVGIGLGVLLTFGSLLGVGSYFLVGRPAISTPPSADETLYADLVSTLTNPELDPAARRAAVLALGNLPDDRVTPLLVDLIAQTDDPLWLDALQQALIARGPAAFAPLRRLNQGLAADLAMQGDPGLHRTTVIRLQTVNRIVNKLLLLEAGDRTAAGVDLSRMNLGFVGEGHGDFRLVLKNQDLSGIQWQGSVLNRAQFQSTRFYHPGADTHADTYDDRTADLSGADLTYANLAGADLTLSRMVNSGLLRADLTRADLTLANLSGANLEHASLIQAVLSQAVLAEARLSKADLTEAELLQADLTGARLAGVQAAGAQLIAANLQDVVANAAQLQSADLSQAAMTNADLTDATLQNANLRNTNLSGVSFRDADLRGVSLAGAIIDNTDFAGTILMEPQAKSEGSFVEAVPQLETGDRYQDVDFSRGLNFSPEQLSYICAQGGLHPSCGAAQLE